MPLHHHTLQLRDELLESTFSGDSCRTPLPAGRFPQVEMRADETFQAISDELLLDGNARQNLATFCQTWEEHEIHRLMDLSINKNMIDKDEYPQTAEIERRCVQMLADLWNAPDEGGAVGCSAIGSSEACMLGGHGRQVALAGQAQAAGKPTDKPNMVCGPVQVVWHKFAKYWDIEIREIPMAPGIYCMDVEQMLDRVDENTIMVVPTFGVTYTGAYEPVAELSPGARHAPGGDRPRHRHPRRRCQRRFPGTVLCARGRLGLPAPPGEVDQHVGPQVRARPAGGGLGALARCRGAAR